MSMDIREKNRKWFDRWSATYDQFLLRRLMWYWQDLAIAELPITSKNILEVACGTGVGLKKVAKKFPHAKISGIDLSRGMLKKAREQLKNCDNIRLSLSDVGSLPYKDNHFDAIFCTESFHHFPDPHDALKEISRVTKPKGRVIVVDVNISPLFLGNLLFRVEPGFVRMYSKKEFTKLFEQAGLRVIKQKRVGLFAILTVAQKI